MKHLLFICIALLMPSRILAQTLDESIESLTKTLERFGYKQNGLYKEEPFDTKDGKKWIKYTEDGVRYGLKSQDGVIVVPPYYTEIYSYDHVLFKVTDMNGTYTLYNSNGDKLLPDGLTIITIFNDNKTKLDGPIIVCESGKWGVYSKTGINVLPLQFSSITPYKGSKGSFYVCVDYNTYLHGVYNDKGEMIVPMNYNAILPQPYPCSEGLGFSCSLYDKGADYFDGNGKKILETKYYWLEPQLDSNGQLSHFLSHSGNSAGKISVSGKVLSEPIPVNTEIAMPNYIKMCGANNKYGIKNKNGAIIIPCEYDNVIQQPSQKVFVVQKGKTYGAYDSSGKMILPMVYDVITEINKGWLNIVKSQKIGIAKLDGRIVCEPKYQEAVPLTADFSSFKVSNDGIYKAIMDKEGNLLTGFVYSGCADHAFSSNSEMLVFVSKDGNWGLYNLSKKKELIPCKYSDIKKINTTDGGYYQIFSGSKFGVCLANGLVIADPDQFDRCTYDSSEKQFEAMAGNDKYLFDQTGSLIAGPKQNADYERFTQEADEMFEKGDYSKAASLYLSAVNSKSTSSGLFNVGVSYYNNNRYNKSIEYFYKCLSSKPSQSLAIRAKDLISKARLYQEQREAKREQIALSAVSFLLGAANQFITNVYQSQYNNNQYYNTTGASTYESSTDYSSSNSSSYSGNSSPSSTITQTKKTCGTCRGTGKIVDDVANYGISTKKYCSECGKDVINGHYHKTCPVCHGKGTY